MTAYYNEIEPYAAAWLRNLIAAGHIAPGDVDERSIEDVRPDDLTGYTQCHWFAGIGIWSYALRQAGWEDDRPVWTGSCPCQPFSSAGKGKGTSDERHLWPAWHHLIRKCRPNVIFGEQVEAAVNHGWLDLVQSDLEGEDYAFGTAGIPAAGIGAPHIRQRLWFVAENTLGYTQNSRYAERKLGNKIGTKQNSLGTGQNQGRRRNDTSDDGGTKRVANAQSAGSPRGGTRAAVSFAGEDRREHGELADSDNQRPQGWGGMSECTREQFIGSDGLESRMADPKGFRSGEGWENLSRGDKGSGEKQRTEFIRPRSNERPFETNGFWRDADWIFCRDGKWRPIEPGSKPLVASDSRRVGRLRAYGNAICAEVAKEFIAEYMECRP